MRAQSSWQLLMLAFGVFLLLLAFRAPPHATARVIAPLTSSPAPSSPPSSLPPPACVDRDGDGFKDGGCTTLPDCDDADRRTHPNAPERCDGKDNDCDGRIDEGCTGNECLHDVDCPQACPHVCVHGYCQRAPCPPPETVPCNALLGPCCRGVGTACPAGYSCQPFGCAPA